MRPYRIPTPEQAEVARSILGDGPTEVVVSGPYGCGKTAWVVPCWLAWLTATHEGKQGLICARSIDSFRAIVMEELEPWCSHHGIRLRKDETGFWVGANYLWRVIGSNVRSHERLKGRNLVGGVVDEAVDLPPNLVEQIQARCRIAPTRLVYATNPDGPGHPFRVNVIDRILEGEVPGRFHTLPMWANPAIDLKHVVEQSARLSGMMRERYLFGRWVAATGAVYPFVGDAVRKTPSAAPVRTGLAVDYGSSAPTHALLMEHHAGGKVWAAGEWRHDPQASPLGPMTSHDQAEEIARWVKRVARGSVSVGIVDNAAKPFEDALARAFRNHKMGVEWVEYDKGTIAGGIRAVERRMVDRVLMVDPKCVFLFQELTGLTWDRAPMERGLERPDPLKPDHGADALRYYVVGVLEANM